MENFRTPTNELIEEYISKFNEDERYYPADQAIINLFTAFPENKRLEDILLKISVINDLYSTNIYGTFKMAKHIQKIDIDNGLKAGDPEVVMQIASGHDIRNKHNTEISFFSFATKYCNWHNQDSYAIYDRFVEKILIEYQKKDQFSEFKKEDLRNFRRFKVVIGDFISFYNLTNHDLKEIDKFLWIYGKEMFPPNYKSK